MKRTLASLIAVLSLATTAHAAPISAEAALVGEFAFNQDPSFPDLFQYFSIGRLALSPDPLQAINWLVPTLVLASADGTVSRLQFYDADLDGFLSAGEPAISDFVFGPFASASLDFGTQTGFSLSGPLLFGGGTAPAPAQILYEAPANPVPEPGTLALLCSGIAIAAFHIRRRA